MYRKNASHYFTVIHIISHDRNSIVSKISSITILMLHLFHNQTSMRMQSLFHRRNKSIHITLLAMLKESPHKQYTLN